MWWGKWNFMSRIPPSPNRYLFAHLWGVFYWVQSGQSVMGLPVQGRGEETPILLSLTWYVIGQAPASHQGPPTECLRAVGWQLSSALEGELQGYHRSF